MATALTIQTTPIACYWVQATHMPSGGYGLSITSLPYTVLWRPCACSHNLHYGEGRMLQNVELVD